MAVALLNTQDSFFGLTSQSNGFLVELLLIAIKCDLKLALLSHLASFQILS
ncbi:hypothetical protein D3C87_869720 [compost metagenome]